MSKDKEIQISGNTNVAGFSTFIPILDELIIYQKFFSPSSVWETNKKEFWQYEKILLIWAYSNQHKHLGTSGLNLGRMLRIFGLSILSNRTIRSTDPPEINTRNIINLSNSLVAKSDGIGYMQQIMNNLVQKGFASTILTKKERRDTIIESFKDTLRTGLEEKKIADPEKTIKFIYSNIDITDPNDVHNFIINNHGVTSGKVATKIEDGSIWVYKSLIIIYSLFGLALLSLPFISTFSLQDEAIKALGIFIENIFVWDWRVVLYPIVLFLFYKLIWKRI